MKKKGIRDKEEQVMRICTKAVDRIEQEKAARAITREIDITELKALLGECQPKHLPADFEIDWSDIVLEEK